MHGSRPRKTGLAGRAQETDEHTPVSRIAARQVRDRKEHRPEPQTAPDCPHGHPGNGHAQTASGPNSGIAGRRGGAARDQGLLHRLPRRWMRGSRPAQDGNGREGTENRRAHPFPGLPQGKSGTVPYADRAAYRTQAEPRTEHRPNPERPRIVLTDIRGTDMRKRRDGHRGQAGLCGRVGFSRRGRRRDSRAIASR